MCTENGGERGELAIKTEGSGIYPTFGDVKTKREA